MRRNPKDRHPAVGAAGTLSPKGTQRLASLPFSAFPLPIACCLALRQLQSPIPKLQTPSLGCDAEFVVQGGEGEAVLVAGAGVLDLGARLLELSLAELDDGAEAELVAGLR